MASVGEEVPKAEEENMEDMKDTAKNPDKTIVIPKIEVSTELAHTEDMSENNASNMDGEEKQSAAKEEDNSQTKEDSVSNQVSKIVQDFFKNEESPGPGVIEEATNESVNKDIGEKEVLTSPKVEIMKMEETTDTPQKVSSQETHVVVKETSEVLKEIPEPVEEIPEPVKEIPEPVEEIPEPVKEIPEPVKEIPEPVKEIPEVVKEIPAVVKETPEVVKETPEIIKETPVEVKETPAVLKETPEEEKETPEVVKETPDAMKDTPQVEKEIIEVKKEIPVINEEIPDLLKETHEVVTETTDVVKETTELVKETPELVEEVKEAPEEVKEIPEVGKETIEVVKETPIVVEKTPEVVIQPPEIVKETIEEVKNDTAEETVEMLDRNISVSQTTEKEKVVPTEPLSPVSEPQFSEVKIEPLTVTVGGKEITNRDSYEVTKEEIEDSLQFIKSKLATPPLPPAKSKRASNEVKDPTIKEDKVVPAPPVVPDAYSIPLPVVVKGEKETGEKSKEVQEENLVVDCVPPTRPERNRKPCQKKLSVPKWTPPKQNVFQYILCCFKSGQ